MKLNKNISLTQVCYIALYVIFFSFSLDTIPLNASSDESEDISTDSSKKGLSHKNKSKDDAAHTKRSWSKFNPFSESDKTPDPDQERFNNELADITRKIECTQTEIAHLIGELNNTPDDFKSNKARITFLQKEVETLQQEANSLRENRKIELDTPYKNALAEEKKRSNKSSYRFMDNSNKLIAEATVQLIFVRYLKDWLPETGAETLERIDRGIQTQINTIQTMTGTDPQSKYLRNMAIGTLIQYQHELRTATTKGNLLPDNVKLLYHSLNPWSTTTKSSLRLERMLNQFITRDAERLTDMVTDIQNDKVNRERNTAHFKTALGGIFTVAGDTFLQLWQDGKKKKLSEMGSTIATLTPITKNLKALGTPEVRKIIDEIATPKIDAMKTALHSSYAEEKNRLQKEYEEERQSQRGKTSPKKGVPSSYNASSAPLVWLKGIFSPGMTPSL